MGFKSILVLWLLALSASVFGQSRPSLDFWKKNPYGYEIIEDGKSVIVDVEAVFEKRRGMEACRTAYKELEHKFFEAEKTLSKLIEEGADKAKIKAAAEDANLARERYFSKMQLGSEVCGDCLTPEVRVHKVDEGLEPEIWYESHGFCTLEGIKEEAILSGYDAATKYLRTPKEYSNRQGGFRAILEFMAIDDKTKAHLKDFGPAEDGEFFGFMAVRANILRLGYLAFSFYIKNFITSKETADKKHFELVFTQAEKGADFKSPEIFDRSPTGTITKPISEMKLPRITGWWYVDTEKGLFRYSTAAQFPFALDHAKNEARLTHLDTIATLRAKFFGMSPQNRPMDPEKE